MAKQLCFAENFGTTNQPLTVRNTKIKTAIPRAESQEHPVLSWKQRINRSFTNWAHKRMKQAVYNGWE